jgi:subtilisin family serine protease
MRFVVMALSAGALCCAAAAAAPILLKAGTIEPVPAHGKFAADISIVAQRLSARGTAPFIVQMSGPVRDEWRRQLDTLPIGIGDYIPEDAFIVHCAPSALQQLAALPFVHWIGAYIPAYKTENRKPKTENCSAISIQTFTPSDIHVISARVQALGGEVLSAGADKKGIVRAQLNAAAIPALAAMAEVEWLEPYKPLVLCNDVAAQAPRLNLQPAWASNLTGRGQVIGHADTGLDTGNLATLHPDFTNRLAYVMTYGRADDWSDPDGHGTHTAGSLLGNGAMSTGQFKGSAFAAILMHQSLLASDNSLAVPSPIYLLFDAVYTNGARIHSDSYTEYHSWGAYNTYSRSVDQFMWDHPDMLVVFAGGNDGSDYNKNGVIDNGTIAAPGTAKNCLTVGAAESDRPAGSGGYSANTWGGGGFFLANPIYSDLVSTPWDGVHPGMAAFSGRGPCDDGRIKPEVVAPGTDIISCRSWAPGAGFGWGRYDGWGSNYVFNGGTSMATPLVAGCAALVRQFYQEQYQPVISNPSAALIKATLINGARSLAPGQYGWQRTREIYARPHYAEGWGQVNLAASLFPPPGRRLLAYDNLSVVFGSEYRFPVTVASSNKLCVTLAWTDWPGSITATKQLVNDVDLFVLLPDGTTNFPNGLSAADHINNVEDIVLDPAPTGTCVVVVRYYTIPHSPQRCAVVIREDVPSGATVIDMATNIVIVAPPNISTGVAFTVRNLGAAPLQFLCSWSWPEYYISTSDTTGGPAYSWVDISSNGVDLDLGYDETTGLMPIGFGVNFFGRTNTQFSVSANGVIGMASGDVYHDNESLPASNGVPPQFIAPFWDDLDPTIGGAIKYFNDGTQLVVSWLNIARKGTADRMTFQTILRRDGKILFQYQTMDGATTSATIGMQASYTGPVAHVAYNQSFVKNNLAVQLAPVLRWLTITPPGGTVAPYSATSVWLATDTALMEIEPYWQYVTVYNDSPGNPQLLKVTVDVVPEPLLSVMLIIVLTCHARLNTRRNNYV